MALVEPYTGGSLDGWPRITTEAWTGAQIAAYAVAMGTALTRTGLRLYYFRRLSSDDYVMFVGLVTMTASFAMSTWLRDYIYAQIAMGMGIMIIPTDVVPILMEYLKYMDALDVLTWFTIFTVKVSYLLFFWRLMDRMHWMTVWWWIVFVFVLASGVICCILPATECTHLDNTMFENCQYDYIFWREQIDLQINVALDIATDLAVISLPLSLIYQVKLTFARKLAITAILCLSVVMIVIASIRLAYAFLPPPFAITDTVWLSFWQTIEANAGVTMISITGFRSLFGQVSRQSTSSSRNSSSHRFLLSWSRGSSSGGGQPSTVASKSRSHMQRWPSHSLSLSHSHSRSNSRNTPLPYEKTAATKEFDADVDSIIEVPTPTGNYLLPLADGFERYHVMVAPIEPGHDQNQQFSEQVESRKSSSTEEGERKPLPPLPLSWR